MKRLALAAVVLSIVACSSQDETPAVDTGMAAPAAAPAPAVTDSAAMVPATTDSAAADSTQRDSTQRDTTAR
jgi:hypothetical protein